MAIPAELEKFLGDHLLGLTKCMRCKMCVFTDDYDFICPAYHRFGYNAYSGGGKVQLARALLDGVVELDEDLANVFFSCTTCGACRERCFNYGINNNEFNPVEITEKVREALFDAGVGPVGEQKEYLRQLRDTHNYFGKEHSARLDWLEGKRPPVKAGTLFFAGCVASYIEQDLARDTVEILELFGEDFAVTPEEWCCGNKGLWLGDVKLARELAEHNLQVFGECGAERIIAQCPGCYKTLLRDYTKLGLDHGLDVLHVTEYLDDLVRDGKLKLEKPGKGTKATYHDPCYLGRHCGIYEPPRRLIEAAGYELVEMPRNRGNALCCGAGGGVKAGFGDWALETAKERVREAEGTGADVLVSSCPSCELNLAEAAAALGSPIRVVDVNRLVLDAMPKFLAVK